MSDLESFSPGQGSESYDPKAFERFKEQMKKNAPFFAAMKKGEQKQKQKEDRLAKILLKFIQTNQKSGILMLAAKLLEENIPASFILGIIVLGNEEMKAEIVAQAQLDLPEPEKPPLKPATEFSLIAKFSDPSLPLAMKAEIDAWGKGIFEAGSAVPLRVLETCLAPDGNLKSIVVDCPANVLMDFVESRGSVGTGAYETYFSFCEFLMRGVMNALKKQVENQKELQ